MALDALETMWAICEKKSEILSDMWPFQFSPILFKVFSAP